MGNKYANANVSARLKAWVRQYPTLTKILLSIFDPAFVMHTQRDRLVHGLPSDAQVVNIGSGAKRFPFKTTNVDVESFANVDVVADGCCLPFDDASYDLYIAEYVLEHVEDVEQFVREMHRVIKPGGYSYITIPFMQSYHGNPDDYYRYTVSGLRALFSAYSDVQIYTFGGPASALCNSLKEFFAILFSFNNEFMYAILSQLFILPFFPIKFIDYFLVNNKNASNHAFSFCLIAKK